MASTVLREGGMSLLLLREGGRDVYECEALLPSHSRQDHRVWSIQYIQGYWGAITLKESCGGNQIKAKKKAIWAGNKWQRVTGSYDSELTKSAGRDTTAIEGSMMR